MSFNKIVGHNKSIEYFKTVIERDDLAHAIILEGPNGIGKSKLGYKIAQATFCETKSGDACGECRQCIKMLHDNHPDFLLIEPDGKQIKSAQIEAFQDFLNVKGYDSHNKVVLINDAEKMNVTSQNKILKTLEEPPEGVKIILVLNKSDALLPTVVSRCQVISLSGIDLDDIKQYLMDTLNKNQEEAELYAKLSMGSIGKAIDYSESEHFNKLQTEVRTLLSAISKNEKAHALGCLSFFSSEKENITEVLDYMILWYRDILLYKKAKVKSLLIHSTEFDLIKQLSRKLTLHKIIDNIETIEGTKRKLNQHGHFDLTIEVMLIKLLEA